VRGTGCEVLIKISFSTTDRDDKKGVITMSGATTDLELYCEIATLRQSLAITEKNRLYQHSQSETNSIAEFKGSQLDQAGIDPGDRGRPISAIFNSPLPFLCPSGSCGTERHLFIAVILIVNLINFLYISPPYFTLVKAHAFIL
jgi:hypothetical protein